MTAVNDVQLLAMVVGAFVLVCAMCVAAAALWLRRRIRRMRSTLFERLGAAAHGDGRDAVQRLTGRWVLGQRLPDRRWISLLHERRSVLVSVSDAERAVAGARDAGAPLGDLESLTRRLRASAVTLDASLRHAQRGGDLDRATAEQAADLRRAAAHVTEAATLARRARTDPGAGALAADAERELHAICAGLGRSYGSGAAVPAVTDGETAG